MVDIIIDIFFWFSPTEKMWEILARPSVRSNVWKIQSSSSHWESLCILYRSPDEGYIYGGKGHFLLWNLYNFTADMLLK